MNGRPKLGSQITVGKGSRTGMRATARGGPKVLRFVQGADRCVLAAALGMTIPATAVR